MKWISAVLMITFSAPALTARTWTNSDGKTIEADFVRMVGERVVVLRIGGKEVIYPLVKLSDEDQRYCEEQADLQVENADPVEADGELDRTADLNGQLPEQVGPPLEVLVETIREDAENNEYVYASQRFEFISTRRLTSRVVSGFAKLYEATYDAVKAMPWGTELNPGSDSGRFLVKLFTEESDFIEAGGIVGSAGTAIGAVSLAQLRYLGVRDTGSRLILEDIEDNPLLVHELTHALRDEADRDLPTWAIEGFAEYMASAPYQRTGRFNFKDRFEHTATYAHDKGGEESGSFRLPMGLESMLDCPRATFYNLDEDKAMQDGASINYAMSLVLMTYFWHADKGKDNAGEQGAPVRAWLGAIRDGSSETEARELLLDGRTYAEIEAEIVAAYRRELKIQFPSE